MERFLLSGSTLISLLCIKGPRQFPANFCCSCMYLLRCLRKLCQINLVCILRIITCCTNITAHIVLESLLKIFCWLLYVDRIVHLLDKGKAVCAAFLDLQKAFDSLDHHILLQRLYDMNVSPAVLRWFKDYLTGRVHRVKGLGQYSDW